MYSNFFYVWCLNESYSNCVFMIFEVFASHALQKAPGKCMFIHFIHFYILFFLLIPPFLLLFFYFLCFIYMNVKAYMYIKCYTITLLLHHHYVCDMHIGNYAFVKSERLKNFNFSYKILTLYKYTFTKMNSGFRT